jgi:hypothetical protein
MTMTMAMIMMVSFEEYNKKDPREGGKGEEIPRGQATPIST